MTGYKLLSRFFGVLGNTKFPSFIQERLNKAYINHFSINMSEFADYKSYACLNALFTRTLVRQRQLEEGFISPCDGLCLAQGSSFGPEAKTLAFSVKQHVYSISELLSTSFSKDELENGCDYANLYLSPKDYHRYHSPCDMHILSATYVPGELYSVGVKALLKISSLYTKNERVILRCKVNEKLFWLVFVGATNVGKMRFNFDTSIQTNAKNAHGFTHKYEDLFVSKGFELGHFELGSTIVLIAQKGLLDLKSIEEVRFGENIANFL